MDFVDEHFRKKKNLKKKEKLLLHFCHSFSTQILPYIYVYLRKFKY